MKRLFILHLLFFYSVTALSQQLNFSKYPAYTGKDLGLVYSSERSAFRIWSPVASEAELLFYKEGIGGEPVSRVSMTKSVSGTWTATVKGNQVGKFYVFRVKINNEWLNEVPDPYAKAVGVNGKRAMVVDLSQTNPEGWKNDKAPSFKNPTDAIVYELHVRDASISDNSGITGKGKFIGLTETGTKNEQGLPTGLDHLKELGITHVHLLPCFDYNSVDETRLDKPQFNWGYDPLNYNAPEGSYSTDPYNAGVRIKEFKQLVQTFHKNGLRVVMDVVYNHTALTESSYFNQLVPGYYYRQDKNGKFSNATACNNEVASERAMVRKFILESVLYWAKEYHIDGFRFDLMGVHDIETMNLISKELHKVSPSILLYGEGWTAGASPLPDAARALKANASKLDRIAVFSDDIRDGIKGSVFDNNDRGFASGKRGTEESIKFGIVASCKHPQVNYKKVNYSKKPYALQPYHTVTYCECHDNHVLWDKLAISAKDATEAERKEMHKLALTIVLTSQGISFLHAGTEFLRTKNGNENSFDAGDSINAINWNLKSTNKDVFDYVKLLIAMRKEHPAFRMTNAQDIAKNIRFLDNQPGMTIIYTINGAAAGDKWKQILVAFNGASITKEIKLPAGSWATSIDNNGIYKLRNLRAGTITLNPYSATILYR